jgi:hypothetical protein
MQRRRADHHGDRVLVVLDGFAVGASGGEQHVDRLGGAPPGPNSSATDIRTSPVTTRIGVVAAITAVEPSWLFIRSTYGRTASPPTSTCGAACANVKSLNY